MRSYVTRYDGNTPVSDSLLGIKYVLDDPAKNSKDISPLLCPKYKQVFSQQYINNDEEQSVMNVYENPDALSIGYMVDKDINNLAFLGNDNPFNSMNMFMSTITGNTEFTVTPDAITIDGNKEYFTRLPYSYDLNDCYEGPYGEQKLFTANQGALDPTVNIHITAESSDDIYMYLKTENEKAVNAWISTEKDDNGNFVHHDSLGSGAYYGNHDYSIVRVGSYEPGTEIEVRLTIRKNSANPGTEEYTIIKDFFFYHLDYDVFHEDIEQLKQNQWNITEYNDRYIKGTINAPADSLMLTTIPSEPGWTVKVDGKKVDSMEILKAFIGIPLEPGEHTVEMKYTPPYFVLGVFTLIIGAGIIVMFWLYDRKHNKVIIARLRAKKREKEGLPSEQDEKSAKNAASLIKSKGAVADMEISEAEQKVQEAQAQKQQNKPNNSGNKKKKKKKK